jgi:hypothetical protein
VDSGQWYGGRTGVQAYPRHRAVGCWPHRSRVAGAKKYKYNTKYNTNACSTKFTPPSGVLWFPVPHIRGRTTICRGTAAKGERLVEKADILGLVQTVSPFAVIPPYLCHVDSMGGVVVRRGRSE